MKFFRKIVITIFLSLIITACGNDEFWIGTWKVDKSKTYQSNGRDIKENDLTESDMPVVVITQDTLSMTIKGNKNVTIYEAGGRAQDGTFFFTLERKSGGKETIQVRKDGEFLVIGGMGQFTMYLKSLDD